MRPQDIKACVEIVAEHPTIGPRYGTAISALGAAWAHLLGREAFSARVFEEEAGSQYRIVAVGTRFFVNDSFLREIKKPPYRWVAPEMIRRVHDENSPVLSDQQVRQAQADHGLNLLVLEGAICARDLGRPHVISSFFGEFIELHRGFLIKELITQGTSTDVMGAQLQSGGYLLDQQGEYAGNVTESLDDVLARPHFIGVTRELALRQFGTWVSNLFIHQPPKFRFRPSEKRLLLAALAGGTDEELSSELAVSVSAVKKSWRQIYERVALCNPQWMPDARLEEEETAERGKTKKQRLLAYLREHMEELRPMG